MLQEAEGGEADRGERRYSYSHRGAPFGLRSHPQNLIRAMPAEGVQ